MATTPTTPPVGSSAQQTLSEWAGPYVTNMLGKTEALADQPYQVYGGPMTAGASDLQSKIFQGLGSLAFPSQLGKTFSSTDAYSMPTMGADAYSPGAIGTGAGAAPIGTPPVGSTSPTGIAAQYMNPYLEAVLQPQLEEMRRQSQINLQPGLAKLTQAGGFGGGRQAIMESEANRNLLQEQNKTIGTGYANAYDKAMQQFNTEQGQAKTLADMLSGAGATQRGIEQEGITADYNEFLAQRDYPQKMLQFQQSMLQGLPISTVSNQAASQSGIGQLSSTVGGLGNILESLKKFNLA